jgi:hypothetical protein
MRVRPTAESKTDSAGCLTHALTKGVGESPVTAVTPQKVTQGSNIHSTYLKEIYWISFSHVEDMFKHYGTGPGGPAQDLIRRHPTRRSDATTHPRGVPTIHLSKSTDYPMLASSSPADSVVSRSFHSEGRVAEFTVFSFVVNLASKFYLRGFSVDTEAPGRVRLSSGPAGPRGEPRDRSSSSRSATRVEATNRRRLMLSHPVVGVEPST